MEKVKHYEYYDKLLMYFFDGLTMAEIDELSEQEYCDIGRAVMLELEPYD